MPWLKQIITINYLFCLKHQPQTDVILGWVEPNGRVFVGDMWANGYQSPKLDDSQDLLNTSGKIEEGQMTLSFTRQRITKDKNNQVRNRQTGDIRLPILFLFGTCIAHSSFPTVTKSYNPDTHFFFFFFFPSLAIRKKDKDQVHSSQTLKQIWKPLGFCIHAQRKTQLLFLKETK